MNSDHMDPTSGAVLHQRVSSLETGQNAILNKLDGLASQIAEKGRTQWGTLAGIVGTGVAVIGAISGLAFKPLSDGQVKLEAAMSQLATRTEADERSARDHFVGKDDLKDILGVITERRNDAQRVTEDRFHRAENDIDGLQKAVVPRGELDERFAGVRAHDADVQRQLDQLRERGEALYGPRDELTRLARKVDELDNRMGKPAP